MMVLMLMERRGDSGCSRWIDESKRYIRSICELKNYTLYTSDGMMDRLIYLGHRSPHDSYSLDGQPRPNRAIVNGTSDLPPVRSTYYVFCPCGSYASCWAGVESRLRGKHSPSRTIEYGVRDIFAHILLGSKYQYRFAVKCSETSMFLTPDTIITITDRSKSFARQHYVRVLADD
jgi:hypothetical protein